MFGLKKVSLRFIFQYNVALLNWQRQQCKINYGMETCRHLISSLERLKMSFKATVVCKGQAEMTLHIFLSWCFIISYFTALLFCFNSCQTVKCTQIHYATLVIVSGSQRTYILYYISCTYIKLYLKVYNNIKVYKNIWETVNYIYI